MTDTAPLPMIIPPELALYADAIRGSMRSCLRLFRADSQAVNAQTPWASRLGGLPYWAADEAYPRNDRGQMYSFLIQLNFAEMPPLPDFPRHGLLQLFIHYPSAVVGRFIESVSTDPDLLMSEDAINAIFAAEQYAGTAPEPLYRLTKPGPLAFELVFAPADPTDYAFERQFGAESALNQPLPYTQPGNTMRDHRQHNDLAGRSPYNRYRQLTEPGRCNTVGGYGRFPQFDDPRRAVPDTNWVVLLKLPGGDDFGMQWGDCQELHVFIRQEALRRADFSHLWLYLAV